MTLRSYCLPRQHLLQQRSELDLAPGASRLDVGEHSLQVSDTGRELLHLAETLVHLLEPIAHQLERLPEAFLQRALELLVDRLAHLIELELVVLLEAVEPLLHRLAKLVEARLVRSGQSFELAGDFREPLALRLPDPVQRIAEPLGARMLRSGNLFSQLAGRPVRLLAADTELLAHHRLQRLALGPCPFHREADPGQQPGVEDQQADREPGEHFEGHGRGGYAKPHPGTVGARRYPQESPG